MRRRTHISAQRHSKSAETEATSQRAPQEERAKLRNRTYNNQVIAKQMARESKEGRKSRTETLKQEEQMQTRGNGSKKGQQNNAWAYNARSSTESMMTAKHERQTPQQTKSTEAKHRKVRVGSE